MPGLVENGVDELDGRRRARRRPSGRRRARAAARPARSTRDRRRRRGVVVAEVDAERGARGRVEAQQRRRPAASGTARWPRRRRLLDDEAALLQLGDERRDRRPREAGQPSEIAPARGALAAAARRSRAAGYARAVLPAIPVRHARDPLPFAQVCQESGEIRGASPSNYVGAGALKGRGPSDKIEPCEGAPPRGRLRHAALPADREPGRRRMLPVGGRPMLDWIADKIDEVEPSSTSCTW